MSAIAPELMPHLQGFGGFALGALCLILSPVAAVWISFHRLRVSLARNESENKERMYELETARQIGLREQERFMLIATREQARLDRAFEAEVDFVAQLARRMKVELDGQLSAMSAPPPKPAAAQVRKGQLNLA